MGRTNLNLTPQQRRARNAAAAKGFRRRKRQEKVGFVEDIVEESDGGGESRLIKLQLSRFLQTGHCPTNGVFFACRWRVRTQIRVSKLTEHDIDILMFGNEEGSRERYFEIDNRFGGRVMNPALWDVPIGERDDVFMSCEGEDEDVGADGIDDRAERELEDDDAPHAGEGDDGRGGGSRRVLLQSDDEEPWATPPDNAPTPPQADRAGLIPSLPAGGVYAQIRSVLATLPARDRPPSAPTGDYIGL